MPPGRAPCYPRTIEAIDKLLTTADVSKILGVPTSTLEGWRHRGIGLDYLKIGHSVRYRPATVERWQRR